MIYSLLLLVFFVGSTIGKVIAAATTHSRTTQQMIMNIFFCKRKFSIIRSTLNARNLATIFQINKALLPQFPKYLADLICELHL